MKNKFLMILLSVVLSCALWLYVALVVSPESEASYENVPVILDGITALENRDLMIVSDTNLWVDLELVGNRQDLNKLSSANITVLADLSHITQPGEHAVKYSVLYPGIAQTGAIDTKNQDPQYITVSVVERSQKTVPVKVKYVGSVPENYIALDAVLDHSTVTVTGPKNEIDRIDHASIVIELTGRTMDIVSAYQYILCDVTGTRVQNTGHITASASEIRGTVKINQIKKVRLVYGILSGGGIDQSKVTVTPVNEEYTWITVSGSQAVLSKIDEIYLGDIDLSMQTQSGRVTFSIQRPAGVDNISGIWAVSYDVEIPSLETRQFQVHSENFELVNVPENIRVEFISKECPVLLRGLAEDLDKLTAANIRVVVDYAQQSDIKLNSHNQLRVSFVVVDEQGQEITAVGAVISPDKEDFVYAYISIHDENAGE